CSGSASAPACSTGTSGSTSSRTGTPRSTSGTHRERRRCSRRSRVSSSCRGSAASPPAPTPRRRGSGSSSLRTPTARSRRPVTRSAGRAGSTTASCSSSTTGGALDRFGGIDGAVLNAGVAATGMLGEVGDDEWRRSLDVNLTAHFELTQRLWPVLREQGIGGSLVYVASKNAFAPGAGFGPYSI